ncbi:hypothetical protein A0256_04540 [Mucilaginibacter sp. PAMC 26640]|nr:hypothetical protein A0256_04540 [Mucilaginibacter sp. PAMC 26640]
MMINESDQAILDIDWFFTNGSEIGFIASAGGRLPASVAKSKENIEALATYFRSLPQTRNIVINPDLETKLAKRSINDNYLSDFVDMAKKGLYTFDKTILGNYSATQYHLVAKPIVSLKIEEIPSAIVEILLQTQKVGSIEGSLNIESFSS